MLEKRAIVAVVLIFVVFFGFQYYMGRTAGDAQPPEETADAVVPALEESAAETEVATAGAADEAEAVAPTGEDSGGLTPGAGLAERLTTIETDLWEAVLSNRGGVMVAWRLKNYSDAEGEPVCLVPADENGPIVEVEYGPGPLGVDGWMFEQSGGDAVLTEGDGPAELVYEAVRGDGARVVKRYTFRADSYLFDLDVEVGGLVDPAAQRKLTVGWPGVEPTEQREDNKALASVAMIDGRASRENLGGLRKVTGKKDLGAVAWATSQSRYFMAAVAPFDAVATEIERFGDEEKQTAGFALVVPFEGAQATHSFQFFAGPQDYVELAELGLGLERAVDMGWSFTRPLSVIMLRALVWAHRYIPNYGLVIIVFSILTKLLFYRLTHRSFTEMKRMQDLQPKLAELKEKYGDDKEKLAQAQMQLYKDEKVSPLGGCFPMLLQMPVFIALFQVLRTTIELRGAPFVLWMTDLSQPEAIAQLGSIPIRVLPILMGVGMLVQQRFQSKDPSQAAIGKMMPIIFTVLFYNFSSGLVLYWLVNTVLSVVQQYYIHRSPEAAGSQDDGAAARTSVRNGKATSATEPPAFQDAVVVDDETAPTKGQHKKSGKRRRRKK